ncbi:hypothetical protein EKO27_g11491 [Xylaria grammica]|uniref:Uncharacterized protein n=1 Tax=Xylaria grammica TaxID=363999 RepID=A0A439CN74_9PEZI|nr:hypothetical protein EKO27_g11491 [Xylaria grammica]
MKLLLALVPAALVYAQADSTGYFPGEPSCAVSDIFHACPPPLRQPAVNSATSRVSVAQPRVSLPKMSEAAFSRAAPIPPTSERPSNAGQAVCSSFLAGELSFTQPGGPVQTPTPVPGSSSSSGNTSVVLTNPPTSSATSTGSETSSETSSEFESVSATSEGTHTDTLIGPSTPALTSSVAGSATSGLPSSSPTTGAAAASPLRLGAGVLAGIMGAIAFL